MTDHLFLKAAALVCSTVRYVGNGFSRSKLLRAFVGFSSREKRRQIWTMETKGDRERLEFNNQQHRERTLDRNRHPFIELARRMDRLRALSSFFCIISSREYENGQCPDFGKIGNPPTHGEQSLRETKERRANNKNIEILEAPSAPIHPRYQTGTRWKGICPSNTARKMCLLHL